MSKRKNSRKEISEVAIQKLLPKNRIAFPKFIVNMKIKKKEAER